MQELFGVWVKGHASLCFLFPYGANAISFRLRLNSLSNTERSFIVRIEVNINIICSITNAQHLALFNSARVTLNRDDGGLLPYAYLHLVRKKRQLISDLIKGPLFAAFRSPLMKALDRNVETLGLWIVTSLVTSIKSVNQSSIKQYRMVIIVSNSIWLDMTAIYHTVSVKPCIYPLTPKIWSLILPSNCYTFPCKVLARIVFYLILCEL